MLALGSAGAQIVSVFAAGMCSAEEAQIVEQKFAKRMKNIEGGPLELQRVAAK